ncbi:ABC transporter permease [Streptomyces sp. NPDC050560]|uniref:ABC transporter permease n=1 Tax=Streptomyces sp. NPDC050560 TaxID=3365630 RepID=UPI0037B4A632
MNQFSQILVSGLISGSVYAAIALGFTLIYKVSGVVNLAQGDFFAAGALLTLGFSTSDGLPLWAAALIAIAFVTVVSLVMERVVIRPTRQAAIPIRLVLTAGVSMIVQGALLIRYGGDASALPAFGEQTPLSLGSLHVIPQDLWLFGFLAVTGGGLTLFLHRTSVGIAMRATAGNAFGAGLTGIDTSRVRTLAFGLSGTIAAAAAVFAAPITFVGFDSGGMLGIKAFVAAVLGGLGRPVGAITGGLVLGLAESLSAGYISSVYSDVIAFAILLLALIYRSLRSRETNSDSFAVPNVFSRLPEGRWRHGASLAGVAIALVFPLVPANGYIISVASLGMLYAIVLLGLDLLRGYTGMVSLGHAAFMGIGAYSTAVLTTHYGWPPLAAMLAALPLSGALAWLLSIVCTRLSGYNLALATMALAVIFEGLMDGLTRLTGGQSGLGGIPDLSILGYSFSSLRSQLYLLVTVFVLLYAWMRAAVRRQPGRVMRAVHADELAARSLGVNPGRVKVRIFVFSALIATVMGSLYAHFQHFASPDQFGLTASLLLLTMLMVGGERTLWGTLIGVAVLKLLPEYFSSLAQYQTLLAGVLLTGVLLLSPSGAAGGVIRLGNWLWGRNDRHLSRGPASRPSALSTAGSNRDA